MFWKTKIAPNHLTLSATTRLIHDLRITGKIKKYLLQWNLKFFFFSAIFFSFCGWFSFLLGPPLGAHIVSCNWSLQDFLFPVNSLCNFHPPFITIFLKKFVSSLHSLLKNNVGIIFFQKIVEPVKGNVLAPLLSGSRYLNN